MDFVKKFIVTKEEGSQVKIEGEIPFTELEKHKEKAIKHLGKNMDLPGFRKGNIPEKMIIAQVGEMAVLSEMAERALSTAYPEALKHHKIDAIGYPQIQLTKIAQGNPLGFTATVAVIPEIKLPDFKKIAGEENKTKESTEVTNEEVETQIKDILRQKLAYERLQKKAGGQTHTHADGTVHEGPEHNEVETHTHEDGTVHEGPSHENDEVKAVDDSELPELTDEFVKTLGQPDQFKTAEDFRAKIREHLTLEKERNITASHRAKITDAIIDKTEIILPQVLIDSELDQMFGQMNEDLTRANLKMDDYLNHIKKSKEDLRKEWTPAAEKRAKLQLILNEIAKEGKIEPDKAQVDAQVDQLLEQYKDADEARVRVYVSSVMTNEAVMKMLEGIK
jgi:trigger factor